MANLPATKQALENAKTVPAILEIDGVVENWVKRVQSTAGLSRELAQQKWALESVLFKQLAIANPKIEDCTPFSKYAAIMELANSGLTLQNGITYMIPRKNVLTFQVGWRGRLEQIQEMPDVVFCNEPICVFDTDEFQIGTDEEGNLRVDKYVKNAGGRRTKESKITDVFFVVKMKTGPVVYHMDDIAVYKIRDHYSDSYKSYLKTLGNKTNVDAGKKAGDVLIGQYKDKDSGQWKNYDLEAPMWVTDEEQSFKKTIVKRTYSAMPNKLAKHKAVDNAIAEKLEISADNVAQAVDPEETKKPEPENFSTDLPDGDKYTPFEDIPDNATAAEQPAATDDDPSAAF